ncbi:specific serine endopeptidase [Cystoisospora suis]|uniref:Specific serine endopeptidase n=1 Tax=Cystoisospora suis TaxID=483139 RepID=A0A2C6KHX9_9APIC|nr:specific serine endopeptidase [Cystoisospora suis]
MGLARAAAKLGVKTTEKLMEQVRLQEKVQREAMEAVFDLIQVENKVSPSSFLGNESRTNVLVFATSPEEQCRGVSSLLPTPIPVDVENRRMIKVVVQATDGEAQSLSLTTPSSSSPPPPAAAAKTSS